MKTYVKAKADYRETLEKGGLYEMIKKIKTKKVYSGIAIVIDLHEGIGVYDSNFFE